MFASALYIKTVHQKTGAGGSVQAPDLRFFHGKSFGPITEPVLSDTFVTIADDCPR